MKTTLSFVIAAAAVFSLLPNAIAQSKFADKPVTIVVGFPAGGPLDAHARLLTERLGQVLGQTILVDYKVGAGGNIGAEFVARAPADGYTIMLANTGVAVINPSLYTRINYQTLRDFAPIARTTQQPLALVVHPSVPARTLAEFIALAKSQPGKINFASAGNGGISHLVPEMFMQAAGINMTHVPYKGSAPAMTDLIAGHAQFMAESIPLVTQYAKQSKMVPLAITSRERNAALPNVPTLIESGFKDFEVVGFYGFLAPVKTPREIVAQLAQAFQRVLETPEIRNRMISSGADPAFIGPEEFGRFLAAETARWARAVKSSGAKID